MIVLKPHSYLSYSLDHESYEHQNAEILIIVSNDSIVERFY